MGRKSVVALIVGFITDQGLRNFNSLSSSAQDKIKQEFGADIEVDVNSTLNIMRIIPQAMTVL